ncbi:MAG: MotA/TolQ/ExbB proton channel family protein [Gammaproteobacteria bacterium]
MDLATLLGILGGSAVIALSIFLGGSAPNFFDVPSLIIVVGGTSCVTLTQVSLKQFLGSFKVGLKAFLHKTPSPEELIEEAVELAQIARKEGILALGNRDINHPFLKAGIDLCIDGHGDETVLKMLVKDINLAMERNNTGITMFRSIASAAPAMGMIGTLIGLVQMFSYMDDPKKIGPAMAIALLTTLYGAVIANAFAIPIAGKLKLISNAEKLNRMVILESVSAIQQGTNPRVLQQMLTTFVPESQREALRDAA